MGYLGRDEDTICACATPPGRGGVSLIRVSGPFSVSIVKKFCGFLPEEPESHRVYYGHFQDISKDQKIDEVLLTYFKKGRSFTGDDTIEISCHGSELIVAEIIAALVQAGCRTAERGEFTYRAFMSGRIDLVQAEGVLSLIESQSKLNKKMALRQLQGGLSEDFQDIEKGLTFILANMEAGIDFSTEDIDPYEPQEMQDRLADCYAKVDVLRDSYQSSHLIQQGLRVVLAGQPNVGKSSLINKILRQEKAIVTEIPGTTRDPVEGQLFLGGITVQFVDTAGLRETDDVVESIGIQKTKEEILNSDVIFYLLEAGQKLTNEILEEFKQLPEDSERILVINKTDLISDEKIQEYKEITSKFFDLNLDLIYAISATQGAGLQSLLQNLEKWIVEKTQGSSSVVLSQRQFEELRRASECIQKTKSLLQENESPEFVAFELQDGLKAIQNILGRDPNDAVMDQVFKEFCIGK